MSIMDHYQQYEHDLSVWMSSTYLLERVVAVLLTQKGITLPYIHNSPSFDILELFYVPPLVVVTMPQRHHAILVKNNH